MDQPAPQYIPQPAPYVMMPVRESNGLGVAGFFISLIGLVIPTGIVALLGLLISLVALGRSPRGFASMGVFLGLLGSVFWFAIMVVAVLGGLVAGMAVLVFTAGAFMLTNPEVIEVTSDMINVTLAVAEYEDTNDVLPEDLAALGLSVSALTDPWGKPYRFQLVSDDPGFDVVSGGSDGEFGTDDDLALSGLDRVWEGAFDGFGEKLEEFGERMEQLHGKHYDFDGSSASRARHRKAWGTRYEEAVVAAAVAEASPSKDPVPAEATPATSPSATEPADPPDER